MNPLSPIAFAGRNKRTSYEHKQGQIKKGTVLVQVETRQRTPGQIPKVALTLKTVQALKPHRGQADTAGFRVPDSVKASEDSVDMFQFTDGTTALVGQYNQPHLHNTKVKDTYIIGALTADDVDYSPLSSAGHMAYQREFRTLPDAMRVVQNQINGLEEDKAKLQAKLEQKNGSPKGKKYIHMH